ncbi:MarR family winged helix-turn-helix transcriptional regulator [Phytomonospora endophytica]|uniref:DNA-binding MarR family transcriptional regulator n=1 Tax=Phytomonospora endophytica TaxID=714109 RepID=A0A841FM13_9ACTN|nr:MarR family transcriptional regulator [Phytomonospora endophytica]MBB6034572.1 DNA-binding MarR family transcriptional regulator [Phytomonospora endophytica]GIG71368.1 MarR family transcriptional regulator [Phytomonospora endophytica]
MPTTDATQPHVEEDVIGDLTHLFFRLGRRVRHRANKQLAPTGMTASQARALRIIDFHGPLRIVDLARKLDIGARSAGDIVDMLVDGGYVERNPDPDDRRSIRVSVNPEGARRADELRQLRREGAEEIFTTLPDGKQRDLLALLTELEAASRQECAPQQGEQKPG